MVRTSGPGTYWQSSPQQPNNDGNCMLMEDHTWYDRSCTERKSAVVCMLN